VTNLRVDRRVPGVGRITASVGSGKPTDLASANAIITKLAERGQLDVLRALKAGRVTFGELRDADRRDKLSTTADQLTLRQPFLVAARRAIDAMRCDAVTQDYYRAGLRLLESQGIVTPATRVADLPAVDWRAIAKAWPLSDSSWEKMARAVSTTLTHLTAGKHSPLRAEVMGLIPRRAYIPRMPSLTPDQFHAAVAVLPEPYRPVLWSFLMTGLRKGELWRVRPEDLTPGNRSVHVRGTKTKGSRRVLELGPEAFRVLQAAVPIPFTDRAVLDAWHRACDAVGAPHTTLHDLRHCFGQWSLDAGVPDADVQMFLGHTTPFMTRLYRQRAARRATAMAVENIMVPPKVTPAPKRGRHLKAVS
jgi:integrase